MASYMIRGIPDGLVATAKARARADGTRLDAVLIGAMLRFAQGMTPAAELGAKGGAARAANMTEAERSESAKRAASARWEDKSDGSRGTD